MAQNKLTPADIHNLVQEDQYAFFGTLTICVLLLTNGAQVTGTSNCIDPSNYNEQMGRDIARERAIDKIWELEGYACKTRGFPEAA